jgi:uncharacterized membrane protein YedE/YeeE
MSTLRRILPPLASGTLFGAGLAVGGMTDPDRVRGFLDLFGAWDPTLAFVMGSAVIVMAIAWRLRERMARPIFADRFSLPDRSDFDARLIAGSALFGVGWGLAGLCPGPAVASLVLAPQSAAIFVTAMLAGMTMQRLIPERALRPQTRGA